MNWPELVNKLWLNDKLLIFCEKCEKVFYIRKDIWGKLNEGRLYSLANLDLQAACCPTPKWLFITEYFYPNRQCSNENFKSFLRGLRRERQFKFFWEILF